MTGRQAEWADDSASIPSDTGAAVRGQAEGEEGTRLWLLQELGSGFAEESGACQG